MRESIKIKLLQNMLEEITDKYDYFITKQEQMLKQTYELVTRDRLTGLYNRQYLEDYASQAMDRIKRHKTQLILIFIDIDNFKYVNDTFGHEDGDKVLQEVSKIFKDSFRKYDVVVRYGGDEFVVFLEERQYDEALIKSLLDNITKRIEVSLAKFKISASYGCAIAPQEAQTLKELLPLADERMYAHKRAKKVQR